MMRMPVYCAVAGVLCPLGTRRLTEASALGRILEVLKVPKVAVLMHRDSVFTSVFTGVFTSVKVPKVAVLMHCDSVYL